MRLFLVYFVILNILFSISAMAEKPYHHVYENGKFKKFRNYQGAPERNKNFKWSYKKFREAKKNINVIVPKDFVVPRKTVLENLEKYKNEDFILWINHASFIIKLGSTTIVTDLITAPNAGPLFLGPRRYTPPALELGQLPKIDLWLNTHLHYDHLSMSDIRNFPFKSAKVLVPLNNGSYWKKNNFKDVKELDWFETVEINKDLSITLTSSQHWNKRSALPFGPGATDKALWGSFLINYKGKKIFFACDTGYSNIYKMMGKKFSGIDIFLINSGAYNFDVISGKKDFSIFHTNPEEALQAAKDINAKKIIPMHYGSFLLGLEGQNSEGPINEPRNRLLKNAENYGFNKQDIKIFNIGQISKLEDILN